MYRNDDKGQKYQLITTNDEENDETEDPIGTSKQSPSVAAQIETAFFLSISVLPIVATNIPVFPGDKVPASLSSIYTSGKQSTISAVNVVSTRTTVEILTRAPTEKGKFPFQPVTTTVLTSAKVPASFCHPSYN